MSTEIIHKCIMVVDAVKHGIHVCSEPDLYENDIFDGNDMNDNISENKKDIPTEMGVYSCKVVVKCLKYWTDCGYEYDVETKITDVKLLYVPIL